MEVFCTFKSSRLKQNVNLPFGRYRVQQLDLYTCEVENQVVHEDENLKFVGEHLDNKTNNHVNVISFNLCYITKVPRDLLNHFPNLQSLIINGSNLKVINKDDLINYRHFYSLNLNSNQIEFLPGDLLEGFVDLETVSFNNNNLRVIEPNIFDGLMGLHEISLEFNPYFNTRFSREHRFVPRSELIETLNETYFARLKFLTDMKNSIGTFRQENENLKKSEILMKNEITNLKRSLNEEQSRKSNLQFPNPSCFCSELKEVLKDDNNFKDFTIMIENDEIEVSKLLLAARSPVLAEILRDNPNTDSFNLVDISVQTFKEILNYFYTDKLQVENIPNLMHVFAAAHRLKIKKLKDIAAMEISNRITPENAIEILFLSNRCEHDKLRQNAFNEVKKNYPGIKFEDEWAVQPEKVANILEAFNVKQAKLLRIGTMIEKVEQDFQDLLT